MDPEALPIGARFGRYIIEDVRGHGSFGVVYAARREDLPRKVALKVLHRHLARNREVVGRFRAEATTIAELHHPHVVDVLDVGEHDGVPFLAMEYLEGETLRELLDRGGSLTCEAALDILLPIFSAVAAVHARGVVHRDIKPDNIVLAVTLPGRKHPKLLDFGVAKVLDGGPGMTRTGAPVGTPYYMSPEQVEEPKDSDPASDQWSLAVVLYHCLTGAYPFQGRTIRHILNAIVGDAPPPPSSRSAACPPLVERAMLRALSKDPAARFRDVRAFAAALLPYASRRAREDWRDEFVAVTAQAKEPLGEDRRPTLRYRTQPGPTFAAIQREAEGAHATVPSVPPSPPPTSIAPAAAPAPLQAVAVPAPPTRASVPEPAPAPAQGTLSLSTGELRRSRAPERLPGAALQRWVVVAGVVALASVLAATFVVHDGRSRRRTIAITAPPPPRVLVDPEGADRTVASAELTETHHPLTGAAAPPPAEARGGPNTRRGRFRRGRGRLHGASDTDAVTSAATPAPEAPTPAPSTEVPEQLTRDQVRQALRPVVPQVRACAAGRSGTMQVWLTVSPEGRADVVALSGIATGPDERACIERVLSGVRFLTSRSGSPSYGFPFVCTGLDSVRGP